DPNAGAFAFQLIPEAGARAPRSFHGVPEGAIGDHDRGAAVFVAVNETDGSGRCKENIRRVRAVFQEDDNGYRGSFPLGPSIVVESLPGRFHRYWLVADHWPVNEGTALILAPKIFRGFSAFPAFSIASAANRSWFASSA